MATPSVLTFDTEGRPIKFEVWLDDLHLFLQITAKDDVSLYDHTSGAAPAPPATADSTARSQWQTRDAHARLAVRSHLPLDEREHFGQHKTAKELYDAVVARYSSPATAAIGRLSLPYLFPDLSAFATVADLITHLRTVPAGAEPGGAVPWGPEPGGAEPRGAEPEGGDPAGAPSPQRLREWYARRYGLRSGAPRFELPPAGGAAGATGGSGAVGGAAGAAGGTGAPGGAPGATSAAGGSGAAGGAAGATGGAAGAAGGSGSAGGVAGAAGGTGATGAPGGATGAAGVGAAAGGSGTVSAGSGGTSRPRPYFVPLLQQVLSQSPPPCPAPSLDCPSPVRLQSLLQPTSPLPGPSPYTGPTGGLTERRVPESRPVSPTSRYVSPVRATRPSRRVPRQRPPAVPGTHPMLLRLSTAPRRVSLPSPPASSLPALADPESNSVRAASPTVTRLLSTVVTDPSFESAAASALVTELVDFAAHCRLDYAAGLVAESESVCPPSVGGWCALCTDVLEDRQEEFECFAAAIPHLVSMLIAHEGDPDAPDIPTPRSYAEAIAGEYSSQWQSAMDAEMASWKSTGTYVDEVPPPGANIVSGMWIFRVKRPPGSPPVFKARYVARGFSQREGVDFFKTFSPTPKMTTLRVLLHVAAQRDYELHSLDFSTAFLQGSLHEEIWLRRPPGFTGLFPPGTQWSLRRPVYGLRQAPREWHDTLRTTLAALGFSSSTADPSLFLRTDPSLPPFYILVYVDNLVFATADTEALAHVKARRTITLTQSHMVQQVLQRFGFTWSSAQATPPEKMSRLKCTRSRTCFAFLDWSCDPLLSPTLPMGGFIFVLTSFIVQPLLDYDTRYVEGGFSQRQGVDFFQTFSPTPKKTTLQVLLHVAAQRDYELHSLDFSTIFLQGSLHEEIWLRRPPGFTGSFLAGTQWSLRQLGYRLRHAPSEWQNTLRTMFAALGFAPSTADPSLFLRTDFRCRRSTSSCT
ncbi:unnamed protein product, partial [Closterium sp. NIES-53]